MIAKQDFSWFTGNGTPKQYNIKFCLNPNYISSERGFRLRIASTLKYICRISNDLPDCQPLGFELAELTTVIQAYRKHGQSVLNYFNRDLQKGQSDETVVINLKDKTGSDLLLDRHYLRYTNPCHSTSTEIPPQWKKTITWSRKS